MPSLSTLDPRFRPWAVYLVQVAEYNGFRVGITSTRRSAGQQAGLWNRYQTCLRSGGSCLPAAPPGRSLHEYGLAVDLVVNGDWRGPHQEALGRWWASIGGFWSPRDPVHFAAHT